jgi:hypothetical protein
MILSFVFLEEKSLLVDGLGMPLMQNIPQYQQHLLSLYSLQSVDSPLFEEWT